MIFSAKFITRVKSDAKRFTPQNIFSLRQNVIGIYIFHYGNSFIYVGQSGANKGIRERLLEHFNGTHNKSFKLWIDAIDGDLMFTSIHCSEKQLDDLERSIIRFLQPKTNEMMYVHYNPDNQLWEY